MARLFISHSSLNNAEAIAVSDWLDENGWDDFFLDPECGIAAGERWEKALNEAARRCEAVVVVITRVMALRRALLPLNGKRYAAHPALRGSLWSEGNVCPHHNSNAAIDSTMMQSLLSASQTTIIRLH